MIWYNQAVKTTIFGFILGCLFSYSEQSSNDNEAIRSLVDLHDSYKTLIEYYVQLNSLFGEETQDVVSYSIGAMMGYPQGELDKISDGASQRREMEELWS